MFSREIRLNRIFLFTAFMFLSFAPYALAHDLWLNISSHAAGPGDTVKAYLGWGHHYPFSDFLSPDRLASMEVVTPKGTVLKLKPEEGTPGTAIRAVDEGTYLVGAAMKAGYYTKTVSGHTFKSKKESQDVISSVWSEKYAKAVFYAGKPGGKNYGRSLGHNLEIIPVNDPASLKSGDFLYVKVMMKGKPLGKVFVYGSYLGFPEEKAFAYATRTDMKGIARIRLLHPGIWRLMVTHREHPEDPALCDYRKYTAFFTFEVQ